MFRYNVLLITGCTGSFGNADLRRFLKTGVSEISVSTADADHVDIFGLNRELPRAAYSCKHSVRRSN